MAEWYSRQTIYGTTPAVRPSGAYRWSNTYKHMTLGPTGTGDSDVILYVDSIAEYGGIYRTSSQNWPHLLVDQNISNPSGGAAAYAPWLSDMIQLNFNIEARLNSAYNYYGTGYNSGLHTAQFVIYFTVQYLKTGQTGYGDYLWFRLTLYDDRYAKPGLYANWDGGTSKYIYNIGIPFTDTGMTVGIWKTISGDLLPYIKTAFNAARAAGALPYSGNLADYKIGGMNMGWEVPGLSQVEMQVKNFSLSAVQTDRSLIVTTPYGSASPSGSNAYPGGTPLTAQLTGSPVVAGATQYVCRGWTGTGSVPASGTSTNTGSFTLTTNSTVTWLWSTNYWLNTESADGTIHVAGRASYFNADFENSAGGAATTANLNAGTPVSSWENIELQESFVTNNADGGVVAFENGTYTNIATLAAGASLADGAVLSFDARIKDPGSGGKNRILVQNESGQTILDIRYNAVAGGNAILKANYNNGVTTGWFVVSSSMLTAESDLASGIMDHIQFVLYEDTFSAYANDVALLTHAVYSSASGNRIGKAVGIVRFAGINVRSSVWYDNIRVDAAPEATTDWKANGTNVQLAASADTYYHFAGWSGDTSGDTNNTQMVLPMNRPRSVAANFAQNITANTSTPEWWLAQYGLTNFNADAIADADGDGLLTWQEYIAGTNPTNPASCFQITGGSVTPQGAVIRWSSVSNRSYSLSKTTSLLESFAVLPGASNLPATPPENAYTNPSAASGAAFYKISVSSSAN